MSWWALDDPWIYYQERDTMADVANYTTDELKRLSTMDRFTAKPGEFYRTRPEAVYLYGAVAMRTDGGTVGASGYYKSDAAMRAMLDVFGPSGPVPRRRVRSFTDLTEIDPPQADMLAELQRRTLRFRKGDVVVRVGTTDPNQLGHLATVDQDCRMGACSLYRTIDPRVSTSMYGLDGTPTKWRLATPADIAAFEARIPKPAPAFKVGDLVVADLWPRWGTLKVKRSADYQNNWVCESGDATYGEGGFDEADLRPATDAEVAAYHRSHCQPQAASPPVISNATHAGRRVRDPRYNNVGVVVTKLTAARLHPTCPKDVVVIIQDNGEATWAPSNIWELL